jgi:dephospho-CoA kinase
MLKVGITGGIGSGKSTVTKIFSSLGVPVYFADDAAKRLMNEDPEIQLQLMKAFGADTYMEGVLNRKYLSSIVFNDPVKLELLNSIVHPVTIHDAAVWMSKQTAPYVIKEAALIFESGSQDMLDHVIGVYAPESLRIYRVMKRDGVTREDVKARMRKQIEETVKMRLCDTVILNDEQHLVIPQILELHERLTELSLSTIK